jgi:hypothetical protein
MGSKFKIFNVLVRNKMQSATVLPSFGLTTDVWNMGQFQLIQFLMYIWGLYQALCGNYHALQAENVRLGELLAEAENRADYAEKRAAHRRVMNNDLHEEISNLEFRVEDAKNDAAEAEQRAYDAEQRAYDLRSKLQTSTECCDSLVISVSRLFHCPIELGVPESNQVLCVGVRNGPAFVSSAEAAKNLNGKHPLLHDEGFVLRTLSGLEDTIKILFKTRAQNDLLAKSLQ